MRLRSSKFVGAACSAALLTACGGSNGAPFLSTPKSIEIARAAPLISKNVRYAVIHSFRDGTGDGSTPQAGLVNVNGTLYGTTYYGGGSPACSDGCGTVFSITPSGTESVIHAFGGPGDGENPVGGLISVNGVLYGTTESGGKKNSGTVFSITSSGAEMVIHSFGASRDGAQPLGALTDVNGTLYGTTSQGGTVCSIGCGTVFAIAPSGKETVLHRFVGRDGAYPYASLLEFKGKLYGTTLNGGANCYSSQGCGTIFTITTGGVEKVFYNFKGGSADGANPYANLINVNGTLYGTTGFGGTTGYGTAFAITAAGSETLLHSFGEINDGAIPYAGLLNVNGTLYGTTEDGGHICRKDECGTIFAMTPSGSETVLHRFGGSGSGNLPYAGLINVNGVLYGTTFRGGANRAGTVFSLSGF